EDGIRDFHVTGVQTCALPILGGELLTLEASAMSGKGRMIKTGSLGDVMQESIQAALTVVRSRAQSLGIAPDYHEKNDIHIHVPRSEERRVGKECRPQRKAYHE